MSLLQRHFPLIWYELERTVWAEQWLLWVRLNQALRTTDMDSPHSRPELEQSLIALLHQHEPLFRHLTLTELLQMLGFSDFNPCPQLPLLLARNRHFEPVFIKSLTLLQDGYDTSPHVRPSLAGAAYLEAMMGFLWPESPRVVATQRVIPVSRPRHPVASLALVQKVYPNDLHRLLKQNPCLPRDVLIRTMMEVVEAVCILHDNQILHLDLKPNNVLIDAQGHASLCDFGLSLRIGTQRWSEAYRVTLWYRPPEMLEAAAHSRQVLFFPLKPSVDLWSLGCLLWDCLCPSLLFTIPLQQELQATVPECPDDLLNLVERQREVLAHPLLGEMIARGRGAVYPELVEIIQSLLAWDPEDRPPATLVWVRLQEVQRRWGGPAQTLTLPERPRVTEVEWAWRRVRFRRSDIAELWDWAYSQHHDSHLIDTVVLTCELFLRVSHRGYNPDRAVCWNLALHLTRPWWTPTEGCGGSEELHILFTLNFQLYIENLLTERLREGRTVTRSDYLDQFSGVVH